MTGIVEDTANAKLFVGAQVLAEACLGLLTLLTDDHEDCRSCDRSQDEIAADGHDPESSCGVAVAALRAAGVPVTL